VPGYQPPPTAHAPSAAGDQRSQHALPSPSFRQDDFDAEMHEAEHRQCTNPISARQARLAAQSLPDATRHGLAEAVKNANGPGDAGRRELAYRATAGDWTREQRDAIRTLAAADPDIRAQALTAPGEDPLPSGDTGLTSGSGRVDDRAVLDDLPLSSESAHDPPPIAPATPQTPGPSRNENGGGAPLPASQPAVSEPSFEAGPEAPGTPGQPATPPPEPGSLGGGGR
jgi:hypothetical protein